MASGTASPQSGKHSSPRASARGGRVIEYQQYIDGQLRKTRGRVKWVDLWTSLTVLGIGVSAYLLLAAVFDHWVVAGGLGVVGRVLLLLGLVAGTVLHLATSLVPFFVRKVNPVYAAAAIERGQPMKNSLINFLLLRKQTSGVAEPVLEAMKEQAAVKLSTVSDDAPVDRTPLIRWGCVFAATLIVAVGYMLLSPKNTLVSFARVLSPWNTRLEAPTRVAIHDLAPGDTTCDRDAKVVVKIRATGMRQNDQATLYYSTTGRNEDDVAVPLRSDDRSNWQATLPPQGAGLKQDVYYRVVAGDAFSARHRIRVLTVPVITVESVHYKYPLYTNLGEYTADNGDIQAIEGTRITIAAKAEQKMRSALIVFDANRGTAVPMALDDTGMQAKADFVLAMNDQRTGPRFQSYSVQMVTIDGEENPKPTEFKIKATADKTPEVKVTEPITPPEKEIVVPVDRLTRIGFTARDLDFELSDAALVFEREGRVVKEVKPMPAKSREFAGSVSFTPNEDGYNFRPGERITFRARAADNREVDDQPQPNVVWSPRYTLVIAQGDGADRRQPQNGAPQPQPPDNNRQQPNNDQQQPNNGQPQQPNQQPNAGEGAQQQQQKPADQNNQPQPGNGQPNGPPQSNSAQGDNKQPQNNQPNNQPNDTANNADNKTDNGTPDSEPKNGAQPQPNHQPQPGQKPSDTGNQPQPPGNQPQPGDQAQNGAQQQPSPQNGAQPDPQQTAQQPPTDPNVDPGKAFDDLRKFFDEKDKGKQGAGQKPEDQTADAQKPDDNQKGNGGGAGKRGGNDQGNPGNDGQSNGSQPASDNAAGTPGAADQMKPSNQPPGAGEKRPGENTGTGQEVARKPADQAGPGEQNPAAPKSDNAQKPAGASQGEPKTPDAQNANDGGAKPNDSNAGKPNDAPKPGENMRPQDGAASQPPPGGQAKPGSPSPNQPSNQSNNGDSGGTQGTSPKPGDQDPNKQPNPGAEAGKPSVNNNQGAGTEKTPGSDTKTGNEGSPESQRPVKPREKTGSPGLGNQQEEGKSPNNEGKQESNAQGETSGDQLGKGQEGGGQKANQQGTGAGGKNTPGDTGSGAADQTGDAAPTQEAGDKARGSSPTGGKPTDQAGDGSTMREGGNDAGGNSQPAPDQQQSDGNSPPRSDANPAGDQRQPGNDGGAGPGNDQRSPTGEPNNDRGTPGQGGGGIRREESDGPPPPSRPTPGADPANLEYAKKVTDLTLERLKSELNKGEVDPELLKRFSSREALEQFAKKFDELRRSATQVGPEGEAARKEYQETLGSLGLRQQSTSQQGRRGGDDDLRNLRTSRRSEPPAKYADRYKAYNIGTARPQE